MILHTVCYCLPVTGHDAIAQLNDLWDADDLFGVVALIGQQNQEKENVGHNLFRVPTQKKKNCLVQANNIIIIYISEHVHLSVHYSSKV